MASLVSFNRRHHAAPRSAEAMMMAIEVVWWEVDGGTRLLASFESEQEAEAFAETLRPSDEIHRESNTEGVSVRPQPTVEDVGPSAKWFISEYNDHGMFVSLTAPVGPETYDDFDDSRHAYLYAKNELEAVAKFQTHFAIKQAA